MPPPERLKIAPLFREPFTPSRGICDREGGVFGVDVQRAHVNLNIRRSFKHKEPADRVNGNEWIDGEFLVEPFTPLVVGNGFRLAVEVYCDRVPIRRNVKLNRN